MPTGLLNTKSLNFGVICPGAILSYSPPLFFDPGSSEFVMANMAKLPGFALTCANKSLANFCASSFVLVAVERSAPL